MLHCARTWLTLCSASESDSCQRFSWYLPGCDSCFAHREALKLPTPVALIWLGLLSTMWWLWAAATQGSGLPVLPPRLALELLWSSYQAAQLAKHKEGSVARTCNTCCCDFVMLRCCKCPAHSRCSIISGLCCAYLHRAIPSVALAVALSAPVCTCMWSAT